MGSNGKFVPANAIDDRIAEIEEELRRLPIELDTLRRLRNTAISVQPESPPPQAERPEVFFNTGPKHAVLRLVSQQRMRTKVAVEFLVPFIDSAASDKSRTLYSTISNLKNARIIREEHGLLRLTDEGEKELMRLDSQ